MASLVEARDPYTGGHLWRVSQFSGLLAKEAGLSSKDIARIALGGFLHDLGKVGVPDAILRKTDRLELNSFFVPGVVEDFISALMEQYHGLFEGLEHSPSQWN